MSEELEHAGILGMRWGVRQSSKSGNNTSKMKNKKLKDLTNEEIQEYLNQSVFERKYKELHPSTLDRGKKLVTTIIAKSAEKKARKYAEEQRKMEADRLRKFNFYKI